MTDGPQVLIYPSEELRFGALPVTEAADVQRVASRLVEVIANTDGALALAAPQVGEPFRMFAFREGANIVVAVNPVLTDLSDEQWLYSEGCLSFPGVIFPIERPRHVRMEYETPRGTKRVRQESDLFGRMFQHEVDHLDGKLAIDLMPRNFAKFVDRKLRGKVAA